MISLRYAPERLFAIGRPTDRSPHHWSLALYAGIVLLFSSLLAIAWTKEIPFGVFTQDPIAQLHGEPYSGLLSNIGILFWSSAAVICLFSSSLLNREKERPSRQFLLISGIFTLLLLLDDLFLLHEDLLPALLGIRQRYVLLFYLILTLLYLAKYWSVISDNYPIFMLMALLFFTLSLAEDTLALAPEWWHYPLEDGAKLFGIVSWFNYFLLLSRQEVQRCIITSRR